MKVMKLRANDVRLPLTVETGASGVAVYATLKQLGQPVEHFSLTLHGSKLTYPKHEKEALCIVEALEASINFEKIYLGNYAESIGSNLWGANEIQN